MRATVHICKHDVTHTARTSLATDRLLRMATAKRTLFTLGYEGLDLQSFIGLLHDAGVHTVLDVRELPLSRKKGFSKLAFSEALADCGIAYLHAPVLGCPKDIRVRYQADGDWDAYSKAFMAYLSTQTASVLELAKLAAATNICLVCFEADFTRCHRTYVAREARKLGAPAIKHLTAERAFPDLGFQAAA
jgi:uncharacterized protein (DUF488 family)